MKEKSCVYVLNIKINYKTTSSLQYPILILIFFHFYVHVTINTVLNKSYLSDLLAKLFCHNFSTTNPTNLSLLLCCLACNENLYKISVIQKD